MLDGADVLIWDYMEKWTVQNIRYFFFWPKVSVNIIMRNNLYCICTVDTHAKK